jgi:hypothetical protein
MLKSGQSDKTPFVEITTDIQQTPADKDGYVGAYAKLR